MLSFFTRPLVLWSYGAVFVGVLSAPAVEDLATILTYGTPAKMTCAEFSRATEVPRWISLSSCRVNLGGIVSGSAGSVLTRSDRFASVIPADAASGGKELFVKLNSVPRADVEAGELEGVLDVTFFELAPSSITARRPAVLYGDRPGLFNFILAALSISVYGTLARRRLRQWLADRQIRKEMLLRAQEYGPVAAGKLIDISSLLKFERRTWFMSIWWLPIALMFSIGALASSFEASTVAGIVATPFVLGAVFGLWIVWRRASPPTRWLVALGAPLLFVSVLAISGAADAALAEVGPLPMAAMIISFSLPSAFALIGVLRSRQRATLIAIDRVLRGSSRGPGQTRFSKNAGTQLILTTLSVVIGCGSIVAAAMIARWTGGPMFFILAPLALAIPAVLWHYARRYGLLTAEEALQVDPRKPVLLLRSFTDDELAIERPSVAFAIPRDLPRTAAALLNRLGPVLALPARNEELPPVGPYRVRLSEVGWQSTVDGLISSCAWIVALLGDTSGLSWEAHRVAEAGALSRVCWLVPPCPLEELPSRWRCFEQAVRTDARFGGIPTVNPARVLAVFLSGAGELTVVTAGERSRRAYEAALAAFISHAANAGTASPAP